MLAVTYLSGWVALEGALTGYSGRLPKDVVPASGERGNQGRWARLHAARPRSPWLALENLENQGFSFLGITPFVYMAMTSKMLFCFH